MAKTKKKTLPKDFEPMLERGSLAELKAVFDVCELDARGGYSKQTALAFDKCPDDLARWLVAQGADLSATDMTAKNAATSHIATPVRLNMNLKIMSACQRWKLRQDSTEGRLSKRLPPNKITAG